MQYTQKTIYYCDIMRETKHQRILHIVPHARVMLHIYEFISPELMRGKIQLYNKMLKK